MQPYGRARPTRPLAVAHLQDHGGKIVNSDEEEEGGTDPSADGEPQNSISFFSSFLLNHGLEHSQTVTRVAVPLAFGQIDFQLPPPVATDLQASVVLLLEAPLALWGAGEDSELFLIGYGLVVHSPSVQTLMQPAASFPSDCTPVGQELSSQSWRSTRRCGRSGHVVDLV